MRSPSSEAPSDLSAITQSRSRGPARSGLPSDPASPGPKRCAHGAEPYPAGVHDPASASPALSSPRLRVQRLHTGLKNAPAAALSAPLSLRDSGAPRCPRLHGPGEIWVPASAGSEIRGLDRDPRAARTGQEGGRGEGQDSASRGGGQQAWCNLGAPTACPVDAPPFCPRDRSNAVALEPVFPKCSHFVIRKKK